MGVCCWDAGGGARDECFELLVPKDGARGVTDSAGEESPE